MRLGGGEDPQTAELRYATALRELAEKDHYDHRVVNDDVDRAAREIVGIINAGRA